MGVSIALSRLWRLPADANVDERRAFETMPELLGTNVPVLRLPPTDSDGTSDLHYALDPDPQTHRLILFVHGRTPADTWITVHSLPLVDGLERGASYRLDAPVAVRNAATHEDWGIRPLGDLLPGPNHEGLHVHYDGTHQEIELALLGTPQPISAVAYQAALNTLFPHSLNTVDVLENPSDARVVQDAQSLVSGHAPAEARLEFIAELLEKAHQTPGLDAWDAFIAEQLMYYAYRHAPGVLRSIWPGHIALLMTPIVAGPLAGGMRFFAARYVDRHLARRGWLMPFKPLDVNILRENLRVGSSPIADAFAGHIVTAAEIPFRYLTELVAHPDVRSLYPLAREAA